MENSLGSQIKRLREDRQMTQQQVADYVGVSRVAVSKWESGDTQNLKFSNLTKMLSLFSISYYDLIGARQPTKDRSSRDQAFADSAADAILSLETDEGRNTALHALRTFVTKIKHRDALSEELMAGDVGRQQPGIGQHPR